MFLNDAEEWQIEFFQICFFLIGHWIVLTVTISVLDVELKFMIEPNDKVGVAGSSVVLDCDAISTDSTHKPVVKWRTLDGQYLNYIGDPHRWVKYKS